MEKTETSSEELSKYEIMIILPPDLGEEASNKELDEVRSVITENGGDIFHEDIWGVREMSYKMKKQNEGFYAVFNFNLDPSKVRKLEKPLGLNQNIIRFIVIKTPENYNIRTLEEYEEEAAKEKAEKEAKKKDSERKTERPKPKPKKVEPKVEPKEEPKEEEPKKEVEKEEEPQKEEVKEEPKEEEKKEEKKPAAKLDDVDERLRSIIDDPDISL